MKSGVDYIGITCVFYCHDGKGNFLLHKRSKKCKDEKGTWDCGGGSLELGETFEEAVKREIKEEYDTEILSLTYAGVHNVLRRNEGQKTHWVALIFKVAIDSKKVKIGDADKIDQIGWFRSNAWPKPLHSQFLSHF